MKHPITLILAFLSASALADDSLPVMVGGNDDLDACMSVGGVKSDSAEIRKGPSETFSVVDSLHAGRVVWLCSESGGWFGIVYPASNEESCEVSSPINPAQPYQGKCKSGWIRQSDIELVAG